MGRSSRDLSGKKFGRLTALSSSRRMSDNGRNRIVWRCKCDCGGETTVLTEALTKGYSRSCGCLKTEVMQNLKKTHGHSRNGNSPTYVVWRNMLQRCHNPKRKDFRYWGGRGVSVCERWHTFENFLADMGEKPPGLMIERVDNSGNYELSNCIWTTRAKQNANRRAWGTA